MNDIYKQLEQIGVKHSDIVEILTERMFPGDLPLTGFVIQIETGEYLKPNEDFDFDLFDAKIFESYVKAKERVDLISDIFTADIYLLFQFEGRVDTILVYHSEIG